MFGSLSIISSPWLRVLFLLSLVLPAGASSAESLVVPIWTQFPLGQVRSARPRVEAKVISGLEFWDRLRAEQPGHELRVLALLGLSRAIELEAYEHGNQWFVGDARVDEAVTRALNLNLKTSQSADVLDAYESYRAQKRDLPTRLELAADPDQGVSLELWFDRLPRTYQEFRHQLRAQIGQRLSGLNAIDQWLEEFTLEDEAAQNGFLKERVKNVLMTHPVSLRRELCEVSSDLPCVSPTPDVLYKALFNDQAETAFSVLDRLSTL